MSGFYTAMTLTMKHIHTPFSSSFCYSTHLHNTSLASYTAARQGSRTTQKSLLSSNTTTTTPPSQPSSLLVVVVAVALVKQTALSRLWKSFSDIFLSSLYKVCLITLCINPAAIVHVYL
jgi:hypothetical protein